LGVSEKKKIFAARPRFWAFLLMGLIRDELDLERKISSDFLARPTAQDKKTILQ
jgi:hypothetical protein